MLKDGDKKIGVADLKYEIGLLGIQNPCRDAKFRVSTDMIHTWIQQRQKINKN